MPTRPSVPADIESIAAALHAATRRAEALFSSVSTAELERIPESGQWSAAQCVAHLTATNATYLTAIRNAVKPAIHLRNHERSGPVRLGAPTRWFLSLLEPPVKTRFRAPRNLIPPPVLLAPVVLKEFQRSQSAVIELLTECRHLDLNRVRFANPFVPGIRFTVGAGFVIIATHERRHLWQAENVATSNRWFAAGR